MKKHMVALALGCALLIPGTLDAQRRPVPVTGRDAEVRLDDGTRLRGELIEATPASLWLAGIGQTDLARVDRVRVRRHGFDGRRALVWVGLGALLSGAGMTIACSQVSGASCSGVFPAVSLSFAVIGGLFSAGMTSSGWQELPADPEMLRPYARFPQGAPPGFQP